LSQEPGRLSFGPLKSPPFQPAGQASRPPPSFVKGKGAIALFGKLKKQFFVKKFSIHPLKFGDPSVKKRPKTKKKRAYNLNAPIAKEGEF
jgi:hypothetical protein